jgi:hypothetical protein
MQKLSAIVKVCILLCILFAFYLLILFYRFVEQSYSRAQEQSHTGTAILEKLGKHMILPSVQPTIAMVVDPKLLEQKSAFFNKAQKGDAIVMYPDKVIIFDVATGKIVDIALSREKKLPLSPPVQYPK